jgi:hypothetical protein
MITVLVWIACGPASDITVLRTPVDTAVAARRAAYLEAHPPLRGFRATIADSASDAWPIAMPDEAIEPELARAATIVAHRIAPDGLVPTLVRVVDILGAGTFESGDTADPDRHDLLRRAGIPVDWLQHFHAPGSSSLVRWIAQALGSGSTADQLVARAGEVKFVYTPTVAGFEVATESGENDIGVVRLQVSSPAYFLGEGDGGAIDVTRQLVTGIEGVRFIAGIQEANLPRFMAVASTWKLAAGSTFTLLPQALPVSEWAQDNGKVGTVASDPHAVVTLVPRYASRGEEGAMFLPGDTFALEAFAAAGQRVVQSPLFFQGGDLLPVLDPKSGQREMLVGEAEIARNRTLGLTQAQVLEAFRLEFGVARCIVLPATSFHVDYELTVRSTPDGLVAFMNDTSAATRLVIRCALPALERVGALSPKGREMADADIKSDRWDVVVQRIADVLSARAIQYGVFPESFAKSFADGPSDSGVGNLQRFLLALDTLVAEMSSEADIKKQDLDRHLTAYLVSMRRREGERGRIAQVLAREGFRIVGVPSTSEGTRSLNTINGVHTRDTYYMPAYGGLFAEFDRAAKAVFEQNCGKGVRVVPILCGESMRREGALHCAVSVLPRR